ncbi:MAG: flagellar hook-associated protein FlgK, partial [Pseudobdellovibrionaceae bacterium]
MSKIGSMMDLGKRSMANSQTALQTVGHNISSKNVEGFSRQRVEQVTNVPLGEGKLRIGSGAKAAAVTRINNPYLEKQIQQEGAELGFLEGRSDALSRVEQVYNEQINKGLNQYMTQFFNAFRELANNPESLATRTLVRESADFLAKDFQRVDGQLAHIQEDLDTQIQTHIEEVNQFAREVASLNEKIQMV